MQILYRDIRYSFSFVHLSTNIPLKYLVQIYEFLDVFHKDQARMKEKNPRLYFPSLAVPIPFWKEQTFDMIQINIVDLSALLHLLTLLLFMLTFSFLHLSHFIKLLSFANSNLFISHSPLPPPYCRRALCLRTLIFISLTTMSINRLKSRDNITHLWCKSTFTEYQGKWGVGDRYIDKFY